MSTYYLYLLLVGVAFANAYYNKASCDKFAVCWREAASELESCIANEVSKFEAEHPVPPNDCVKAWADQDIHRGYLEMQMLKDMLVCIDNVNITEPCPEMKPPPVMIVRQKRHICSGSFSFSSESSDSSSDSSSSSSSEKTGSGSGSKEGSGSKSGSHGHSGKKSGSKSRHHSGSGSRYSKSGSEESGEMNPCEILAAEKEEECMKVLEGCEVPARYCELCYELSPLRRAVMEVDLIQLRLSQVGACSNGTAGPDYSETISEHLAHLIDN